MKRDSEKIATALLDSTVLVIANEGFTNASTRRIATACDLPDAYIYQYFQSKDDLIAKAFSREDTRFAYEVKRKNEQLTCLPVDIESKRHLLFKYVSDYFITNGDVCKFYLQYYHSPYFMKYSEDEHGALWEPVTERVGETLHFGKDTSDILHNSFNMVLMLVEYAIRNNLKRQESGEPTDDLVQRFIRPWIERDLLMHGTETL